MNSSFFIKKLLKTFLLLCLLSSSLSITFADEQKSSITITNELTFRGNFPNFARGDMRTVCVVNTLAGNYAFLPSEYSGVLIVDLSDPWNPKMCTSFSTPGFAIRAAVDAPYLFVADMMKGLRIANIENIAFPKEVGFYPPRIATIDVYAKDRYAFTLDTAFGMIVLDVKDPQNPSEISELKLAGEMSRIQTQGNLACVAAGSAGVHLIDISDPHSPKLLSTFPTTGEALTAQISGTKMCIATRSSVQFADVSDPLSPKMLSSYGKINGPLSACFTPDANQVYVSAGNNGLILLDITDPLQPHEVTQLDISGIVWDAAVDINNEFLFAACYSDGIRVIDIRPESNLRNQKISELGIKGSSESIIMELCRKEESLAVFRCTNHFAGADKLDTDNMFGVKYIKIYL